MGEKKTPEETRESPQFVSLWARYSSGFPTRTRISKAKHAVLIGWFDLTVAPTKLTRQSRGDLFF